MCVSELVWVWLNLLCGACWSTGAGPRKRSRKESGRSASSAKLLWAHSLSVITMPTNLSTHREHTLTAVFTGINIIMQQKEMISQEKLLNICF